MEKLAISNITCTCGSITFFKYLGLSTTVVCGMCNKVHWVNK